MGTSIPVKLYHAAPGAPFSEKEAPVVGTELERLAAARGVDLPALPTSEVVKAAKSPDSPLHKFFTWDDTQAATQYRLAQARNLINHIRVEIKYRDRPEQTRFLLPGLVNVRTAESPNGRAYVPITSALVNEAWLAQLAAEALRQQRHWLERYQNYRMLGKFEDLEPIFQALEPIFQAIEHIAEQNQPE